MAALTRQHERNLLTAGKIATLEKPGRYSDGDGLYLVVRQGGSKQWTFLYRHRGERKEMGFGSPRKGVTLAMARRFRDEARAIIRRGGDPLEARRQTRQLETPRHADHPAVVVTGSDTADYCEALLFLNGSLNQWDIKEYANNGSWPDITGRQAIARLLLSEAQLPSEIRRILAALFDPITNGTRDVERRIVFEFKRGRRRVQPTAELFLASKVYDRVRAGMNVTQAVESVANEKICDTDRLMRLWGQWRQRLEKQRGPLNAPSRNRRQN
jgi:hypothetical protein